MVSAACDGIDIAACAQLIFGDPIHDIVFTDSSSARQLASRQGCGSVRHLSGKILWVQEEVADEALFLKQVSTVWNVADIGTKILSKQRLMLLMHETGLVYVATEDPVGTDEFDRQVERSGNVSQIQRLTKTILGLSLAMGLEPVQVLGQQCSDEGVIATQVTTQNHDWYNALLIGFLVATILALVVIVGVLWKYVRKLKKDG